MTPRRLPTWARVLLGLAALAGTLLAAAALWLWAAFSGGFDDLLDVRSPSPDDGRVVQAQERSEVRLTTELAALTGGAPSGSAASCVEGQHNWKIDDPYDLLCTQTAGATVLLGTDPVADLLRLHDALLADGWVPSGVEAGLEDRSSLQRMVAEYGAGRLPAASYRRDGVELVVETAHRTEPTPYGWPGAAPDVPEGRLAALLLLREEYFSA